MDWRDWLLIQGNWDNDTKSRIKQYEDKIFKRFRYIYRTNKILCDCGSNILKKNWLQHTKTEKHTKYIILNFD